MAWLLWGETSTFWLDLNTPPQEEMDAKMTANLVKNTCLDAPSAQERINSTILLIARSINCPLINSVPQISAGIRPHQQKFYVKWVVFD